MHPKFIALMLATIIQMILAGILFLGGLLDPLLGLIVCGVYFFVIGYYLLYRTTLSMVNQSK